MSDTLHDATRDTPETASSTPPALKADGNALAAVPEPPGKEPRRRGCWRVVCLALVALVLALTATVWFGYQQFQTLHVQWSAQSAELTQLAQSHAATVQAQTQAQRALIALQTQTAQLAALQTNQAQVAVQLQTLQQTVQDIMPSEDDDSPVILLAEVGRLVEIAQQSVRLSGSVQTALVALESAQNRLIQRQALPGVQQALQDDMQRLRAVPAVDVGTLAARLDALSDSLAQAEALPGAISSQGLAVTPVASGDACPDPAGAADTAVDTPWWELAWRHTQAWSRAAWCAVAQDLRGLVQIRRIDDRAALLISPEQTAMLRDTVQHRVAAARLALLMRAPSIWTAQLTAVQQALQTRFDAQQASVQDAQTLLRTLLDTPITVDLPTLDASARAVESQRALWLRMQDGADNPTEDTSAPMSGVSESPSADGERS